MTDRHDTLGQRNTGIEGRVLIKISEDGGRVASVAIASTRPLGASAVLENRGVMDAIGSLRLLYSLCGTAHTAAGLAAAEAALAIAVAPEAAAARHILVAGESLGQLLWRLMLDIPQTAGEDTAFDALRDARARLARLAKILYPRCDWIQLGGAGARLNRQKLSAFADTLDEIAALGVFGEGTDVASILSDPDRFAIWAAGGKTPIARVFRTVAERGWSAFGASDVAPLPPMDAGMLAERLAADDGRRFAAAPDLDGQAHETGALARHRAHPLISALIADHGAGLLAQLAAKLVDVAALIADIGTAADTERQSGSLGDAATGRGLASVESARGRLVHYLEIEDGRTRRYRILAPTEWNFHCNGPLARGLLGSEIVGGFSDAVALLVTAIDPCVQFDIEMT